MNAAELHLILNHIPILGTIFALSLLAYAMIWKKPEVLKASLGVFVLSGLFSIGVYLTGEPAEEVVESLAQVSEAVIEPHEEAAFIAMIGSLLLGVLALAALVAFRSRIPAWVVPVILTLGIIESGLLVWTGYQGGQIAHPETRTEASVFSGAGQEDLEESRDD